MNHYPTASAAATILAAFNLNVSDGPAAKYFAIACAILGAVLMAAGFLRAALTSAKAVQTEAETPRTPSNPPVKSPRTGDCKPTQGIGSTLPYSVLWLRRNITDF